MPKESLRDKLEGNELDLSLSNLDAVPVKELALIPKATHLDLSCNQLTVLPDSFCTLTHLIKLDLSKNSLSELPSNFGQLENLQQLDLLGNKLRTLPRSFCQLRKLRWLDLKDNPLEEGLKKNAGDCLDEAQCRKCATRILMYMTDLDEQLEKQWQLKKQKKEKEEAKKKLKEERERQQKRQEKKAEKERRRREHEARRAQEILAQNGDTSDEEFNAAQEKLKSNGAVKSKKASARFSFFLLVFISILALLVGLLVAVDIHCSSNLNNEICRQHWKPLRSQIVAAAETVRGNAINFYHQHIETYLFK
ncbi:leucine-rich repeat-containing protein 59 [Plakobranchus ocellatus]|uniref:Leucine-rich repeat-containing protein 59 n=1 Tax=Plakobranchus ocellatus TaxID=259542 RepID=A0AAV4DMQ3_9GAST|nr:leucine-rich repeat-containing protein 59 [Plakobranchus ocellatus]